MSNIYKSLLLTVVLPLALVGCGGSGSAPAPGPQPGPGPQPTKIIAVTVEKQDADNTVLTAPVLNGKKNLLNNQAFRSKLLHDDNLITGARITVEYTGDNEPAHPSSASGVFYFDSMMPAACPNPVSSGDECVTEDVIFEPTHTTDDIKETFFDGMLTLHGYVPFRMFPVNNTMVTGTPTKPSFHMVMSRVDPGDKSIQFNTQGMPSTAIFTTKDIVQDPSLSAKQPLQIPFTVTADKKDKSLIDVDYSPTKDISAFIKAPYLKTYGSDSDTQLAYTATAPSDVPAETATTIPVQATLTRAFVITTDNGEAYVLNNPTDATPSLMGTTQKNKKTKQIYFASMDYFTGGKSLNDITLPVRNSMYNGFLNPIPSIRAGEDTINQSGVITGDTYDKDIANPTVETQAEKFIARSRFQYDDGVNYVISLVANTNVKDPNAYHFIETDDGGQTTAANPYVATLNNLPKLSNITMAIDYPKSEVEGMATILFSGFNTKTQKEELYYTSFYYHPAANLGIDDFDVHQIGSYDLAQPMKFSYNTYDSTQIDQAKMLPPEEKFVYFNKDKTQMSIIGYDTLKEAPIVTTVKITSIKGDPIAFACSDTDTGAESLNNICYMMTHDASDKTTPYHMYSFDNLDVDAGKATSAYSYSLMSFDDKITKTLTKAVIDGNTGALLTLGADDSKVSLYTLNGLNYQKVKTVTLPKSPTGKDQLATNIFEY